ncbi:L10-interacting MYB domain-containing protein-like [Zingiber officinale]|uniref:L10-interacting MYB domain-containing protein-like n=1 Tax=Zingiber officinale TaxID=94328 RepID=UPI001C4CCBB6|nr:L10-interacting MYB domain-containing protein-like [Zingiber officinale]
MDKIFIDVMLDQQVNGNRVGSTFTSTAYKEMVVICREKTKIPLTKDHLKNRMKTLKTNFNSCYDLFKNAIGVQWHAESKRFEAEEEVWKQLIDANPSIKKWRYTPAPHYEKLFELFAYDKANGQGASTVAERNVEIIQEEEQRDDIHVSFEVDIDSSPFVEGLKKRKITSVDAYGNKKSSALDLNIKEVVAAIDRSSSFIENKPFHQQKLNEKLYKDLVSVGVLDENILDVYLFLGENKEKICLLWDVQWRRDLLF